MKGIANWRLPIANWNFVFGFRFWVLVFWVLSEEPLRLAAHPCGKACLTGNCLLIALREAEPHAERKWGAVR